MAIIRAENAQHRAQFKRFWPSDRMIARRHIVRIRFAHQCRFSEYRLRIPAQISHPLELNAGHRQLTGASVPSDCHIANSTYS
jgi:hypothetical protein